MCSTRHVAGATESIGTRAGEPSAYFTVVRIRKKVHTPSHIIVWESIHLLHTRIRHVVWYGDYREAVTSTSLHERYGHCDGMPSDSESCGRRWKKKNKVRWCMKKTQREVPQTNQCADREAATLEDVSSSAVGGGIRSCWTGRRRKDSHARRVLGMQPATVARDAGWHGRRQLDCSCCRWGELQTSEKT